jgi:hypothetical protein
VLLELCLVGEEYSLPDLQREATDALLGDGGIDSREGGGIDSREGGGLEVGVGVGLGRGSHFWPASPLVADVLRVASTLSSLDRLAEAAARALLLDPWEVVAPPPWTARPPPMGLSGDDDRAASPRPLVLLALVAIGAGRPRPRIG